MSGMSVGGPAPSVATQPKPVESAGKVAVAQARQAAVSATRERRDDDEQRPVAYGVKGSVETKETSSRYDARSKVREEREDRGQKVDRRA